MIEERREKISNSELGGASLVKEEEFLTTLCRDMERHDLSAIYGECGAWPFRKTECCVPSDFELTKVMGLKTKFKYTRTGDGAGNIRYFFTGA